MRKLYVGIALIPLALILSCNKGVLTESSAPVLGTTFMTFNAINADNATKAIIQNGAEIFWNDDDEINLFYGDISSACFGYASGYSPTTSFSGYINLNPDLPVADFWAVYPYNYENSCDGSSVTVSVPSVQKCRECSFDPKAFLTIARTKAEDLNFVDNRRTQDLAFYNLCGGVKFTVSRRGIKSVTFQGNNGEILAGKVKVALDDSNKPYVENVISGSTSVTVNAPFNDGFFPGIEYYAPMLPAALENGMTLTFNTADGSASYSLNKAVEIKRSVFGCLDEKDKGLDFSSLEGNITFEDSYLANDCNWTYLSIDQDGDGKVSYSEAASAKLFSGVFSSCRMKTFPEFKFFTNVTELDCTFEYCSELKSVELPNSVKTIKRNAFVGCTSLEEITLPASVTTIKSGAFDSNLQKVILLSETPPTLEWDAFGDNTLFYVPESALDTYKSSPRWPSGNIFVYQQPEIFECYIFLDTHDLYDQGKSISALELRKKAGFTRWENGSLMHFTVPDAPIPYYFYILIPGDKNMYVTVHDCDTDVDFPKPIIINDSDGNSSNYKMFVTGSNGWANQPNVSIIIY